MELLTAADRISLPPIPSLTCNRDDPPIAFVRWTSPRWFASWSMFVLGLDPDRDVAAVLEIDLDPDAVDPADPPLIYEIDVARVGARGMIPIERDPLWQPMRVNQIVDAIGAPWPDRYGPLPSLR